MRIGVSPDGSDVERSPEEVAAAARNSAAILAGGGWVGFLLTTAVSDLLDPISRTTLDLAAAAALLAGAVRLLPHDGSRWGGRTRAGLAFCAAALGVLLLALLVDIPAFIDFALRVLLFFGAPGVLLLVLGDTQDMGAQDIE
ncbi:MAG: hypothetical protein NW201_12425 [Gemmatimonadales bacterium]|nr:hypothetical protein [Gemmatimonadales bacterium]